MSTITYVWGDEKRTIVIASDGRQIPADAGKVDFAVLRKAETAISGYQAPPPAVPASVKIWQARASLAVLGKLEEIDSAIAGMKHPAASAAWQHAPEISGDSPLVNAMADVIGLKPAEVDALFIQAAALKV